MKNNRRTILETLENSEDYVGLRSQMVDDLVAYNLVQPLGAIMTALESYLMEDFRNMDDIDLQNHYDNSDVHEELGQNP
jgi:hypothetical protein